MPNRIPIDQVQAAVATLIANARLGLKDAATTPGVCVTIRPGKFQISLEAVWPPPAARVEEQTSQETQTPGEGMLRTTTEQPYSGDKSVTTKTGNYVQSGTQGTGMSGGSQETTDYTYYPEES